MKVGSVLVVDHGFMMCILDCQSADENLYACVLEIIENIGRVPSIEHLTFSAGT